MEKIVKVLTLFILLSYPLIAQDKALILYTDTYEFKETIKSISQELEEDIHIQKQIIQNSDNIESIFNYVNETNYKCVILLGNLSINLFKEYLKFNPKDTIASIQLMALKIKTNGIPLSYNTYGISYEIPVVSVLTKLRHVVSTNINNIGIIYRESDRDLVHENIEHCLSENFDIKSIKLPNNKSSYYYKKNLKKSIEYLIYKKNVKTLIIPNDNKLLTPKLIKEVWKPATNSNGTIVVTGVNSIVSPEINFGTYTMVPKLSSIGFQVVDILYSLKESNWVFKNKKIEPPLALYDIVDLHNLKNRAEVNSNINSVSKILEK